MSVKSAQQQEPRSHFTARQSLARAVFGPITECLYGDTFTPFILHRIVIFQVFSATRQVLVSLTTAILSFDFIQIALVLIVNPEVALQRLGEDETVMFN